MAWCRYVHIQMDTKHFQKQHRAQQQQLAVEHIAWVATSAASVCMQGWCIQSCMRARRAAIQVAVSHRGLFMRCGHTGTTPHSL